MHDSVGPPIQDGLPEQAADCAYQIFRPDAQTAPVVFASPHSGRIYPVSFLAAARLGPVALRRSEDAFIDELYALAPKFGAPLIRAHFPRAYVDPNREAYELDPAMFTGPLPDYANVQSPRVSAGLGTIARVVTNGEEIYRDRLTFEEVRQRIETFYHPYHDALRGLLDDTRERFGCCLLIDCHSMPSVGGPMDADPGAERVDMVLGDCHGQSCNPAVTDLAEETLSSQGYRVKRNTPYAGGYTTRHYGSPATGMHALQIEVNRALYMNETTVEPTAGLAPLKAGLTRLIERLVAIDPKLLTPTCT